jgi:hypothetical protein
MDDAAARGVTIVGNADPANWDGADQSVLAPLPNGQSVAAPNSPAMNRMSPAADPIGIPDVANASVRQARRWEMVWPEADLAMNS